MDFNFLYKQVINDKIDPLRLNSRYFTLSDDGFKYTEFFRYKLANAAKAYFSDLVLRMDSRDSETGKGKYTYEKEGDFIDYDAVARNKGPYADKFIILNEKWEEYKNTHQEEFDEQERIANTDSEEINISSFKPYIPCSLDEAIQGYWCATELLKKYGKDGECYDMLPKYKSLISKKEFKDKHNLMKERFRKELGIPEEDSFKETLHEIRPRMKGGKHSAASDDTKFEEFTNEFAQFIIDGE